VWSLPSPIVHRVLAGGTDRHCGLQSQIALAMNGHCFGQGLGNFLIRRASGWGWLEQAVLWIGLMVAATIGSILYLHIGAAAIWVPVSMASILAGYSLAMPQPD
jgi:uncharacterized membrane protein YoaK (UPF0700 family)